MDYKIVLGIFSIIFFVWYYNYIWDIFYENKK